MLSIHNVPGAFSSNEGEDFRCVLEELCRVKEAEVSVPLPEYKWPNAGGGCWETATPSLGESSTRNIGESPREGRESFLSQILEAGVDRRYYLTAKACRGILRRASKRGKELPTILKKALERQAREMEE